MIKALEDQLQAEKSRREELAERFKQQLAEFEAERDAIEKLRLASNNLEKRQSEKAHNASSELDMVPSRETNRSQQKSSAAPASGRTQQKASKAP